MLQNSLNGVYELPLSCLCGLQYILSWYWLFTHNLDLPIGGRKSKSPFVKRIYNNQCGAVEGSELAVCEIEWWNACECLTARRTPRW